MLRLAIVLALAIGALILFLVLPQSDEVPSGNIRSNVHLLTFANERFSAGLERLRAQAAPFKFDTIICVTENELQNDTKFKHKQFMSDNPRGCGFWIWKPYIIHQRLLNLNDNDVLVYTDAGCELNARGISRFKEYVDLARGEPGMVTFELCHKERAFTKHSLVQFLNAEMCVDSKQILAGISIMRKCPHTIEIIEKWLQTCENYHLIDDSPSETVDEAFVEHRHDQSVFSLVCKQNGTTILPDETYFEDWNQGVTFPILAVRNSTSVSRLPF